MKPDGAVPLRLAAITREEARRFVGDQHRHNLPPKILNFVVGLKDDTNQLRGVAIVARPVARGLDDGDTAEVVRVATDGVTNGCSMLYGACTRAAKALGFRRLITYTLQEESGSSLRASGWTLDATLKDRGPWGASSVKRPRVDVDLFGNERVPPGPKLRWIKDLST